MSFSAVHLPRSIFYGKNSFSEVGKEVSRKSTKTLIISDEVMHRLGYVDACCDYLQKAGVDYVTYLGIASEPTDVYVQEALDMIRSENCDSVTALGGGSCIDTAKAAAVLAENEGYIGDYAGGKTTAKNDPLPLTAIPTTGGTGSEATDVTVITNTTDDVKMMIKQPAFMPDTAIVDPLLTVSTPPGITAATGVDALTHAVEAYISKKAHAFTDELALSAIKRIMENLGTAYRDGTNVKARDEMIYGSMQAGMAFSNASVCLVHGMSRPIGALFHVPHGISNAMLLPVLLEYAKPGCTERLAAIGRHVFPGKNHHSDPEVADMFVDEVVSLCEELTIPNLKTWGISEEAFRRVLPKMAADAVASGSPANNPVVPSAEHIVELYEKVYAFDYEELKNQRTEKERLQ
ncbi:iron-containing alcohol dehydrogenase [Alkalicoccus saliphilus]|uniref:Alcohol dehydrogenase n=1 Tax=Alkalicoccus saliphilus TaxID=200989 RepID=A0A2T4U1U2_9BACI|nr:iron-containing alcohol dehydrogenase [Alkalicoccus saliphilus]PTL37371.1 alcohol dehydrogenase [Alkalicoccus saliphilus]